VRAAAYPHDPSAGVPRRVAFAAHTAGGWAAAGRPGEGRLVAGAPATFAVWEAGQLGTDGLPDVRPGTELPRCLATVRAGTAIHDPHALLR
jgi:predicted amidohydrolase YtcJ